MPSGFPYVLQFKPEFCNKELMIRTTVSSGSGFCWLYRVSPSLAAKNIISLIWLLTICWCPCVESSLGLLEKGAYYGQHIILTLLFLQQGNFLSPPETSTTELLFYFSSSTSFFLGLLVIALCSSPAGYWIPSDPEGSSSHVLSFAFSYLLYFHIVHRVITIRILECFVISSSSGPHFVRTFHYNPSILGGPAWHGSLLHWFMQSPLPQQGSIHEEGKEINQP